MKEYRLYLLDFDGTLADSARSLVNVYRAGFEEIDFPYDPEMASVYMHMSLGQAAKMAGIPEKEYVRFALKINDALDYPENLKAIDFFPESKEVMETLHRAGKKLSIVSGNTERHIRLILEAQGIENLFDTVVGSVVDRRPKPYPDPILAALAVYPEIKKEEAVYIGDSLQDLECAKAAGIDGILIDRNGVHPEKKAVAISSLRELLSPLKKTIDK